MKLFVWSTCKKKKSDILFIFLGILFTINKSLQKKKKYPKACRHFYNFFQKIADLQARSAALGAALWACISAIFQQLNDKNNGSRSSSKLKRPGIKGLNEHRIPLHMTRKCITNNRLNSDLHPELIRYPFFGVSQSSFRRRIRKGKI